MAVVGGIFYGLLIQTIALLLGLSSELALVIAFFVFFFYLASRFLLLFSGVNTSYYSKAKKTDLTEFFENTHFYPIAQWVGKFYHYHDTVLFIFLFVFSIFFLISLGIDWCRETPFGRTAQELWNSLIPMP